MLAFAVGVLLLGTALFVPALHGIFGVEALGIIDVIKIVSLAIAPTVIIQIVKLIKEYKKN